MSMLQKTKDLREEAWGAVQKTAEYLALKALDDAVVAQGGESQLPALQTETGVRLRVRAAAPTIFHKSVGTSIPTRISQARAASDALIAAGEPLPIGRLLEKAREHGAEIGGNDPLANFRSTLSKDPRFRSIARNNMYFWWFAETNLPESWLSNEAPDLPLQEGSSASVLSSSQKGGDGHAATTAH